MLTTSNHICAATTETMNAVNEPHAEKSTQLQNDNIDPNHLSTITHEPSIIPTTNHHPNNISSFNKISSNFKTLTHPTIMALALIPDD
jgi:hypothetical protein